MSERQSPQSSALSSRPSRPHGSRIDGTRSRQRSTCVQQATFAALLASLLLAVGLAARPAGAKEPRVLPRPVILFSGDLEVVEGETAHYVVDVFVRYTMVRCPEEDPGCNLREVHASVDFETMGITATPGQDFLPVSGTLSKAFLFDGPGDRLLGTIEVKTLDDTLDEGDETFKLVFSSPSFGVSEVVTTILDDDAAVRPFPGLAVNDVTIQEGDSSARTAVFSVTLSHRTAATVSVDLQSVDGTARSGVFPFRGADYRRVGPGTLTFGIGETSKTVEVAVFGDASKERDETFTIELSNPTNAFIVDGVGQGTIRDDD